VKISGSNGVGKTTLLRIANGLLRPDGGIVSMNGLHPERDRREYQRRLGFLPAGDRYLYARMSVRGQLEFWARLALLPRSRRRSLIDEALFRFGLEDLARRRVERLSQGQRQRVRLATAFFHDPALVLLDEPLNSLDDDGCVLLLTAVRDVVERKGAVVWCSPSRESVPLAFDGVYLLESGRLVEQ
jgi:ABC-2 type transport system ATP-binding protein